MDGFLLVSLYVCLKMGEAQQWLVKLCGTVHDFLLVSLFNHPFLRSLTSRPTQMGPPSMGKRVHLPKPGASFGFRRSALNDDWFCRQGCGIRGVIPTSVIQGNLPFRWEGSLCDACLLYHRSGHFPQPWFCLTGTSLLYCADIRAYAR